MKWKYGENLSKENILEIEKSLDIKLPNDCLEIFSKNNKGKPVKSRFNLADKDDHVLDYLIDFSEAKSIAKRIGKTNFIPIASDPFGNYIGYKIDRSRNILKVVFWDHENDHEKFVSESLEEFISMLY